MNLRQKRQKIARVLREFKAGTLKSSSGEPVKSRQQAIAIAMSEAGMEKKDKSDAYWDAYIDTMCGSMSKEGVEEEEEEEMDANPAEARCKGHLSSLRKRRKKG
jgi:hypothetical protein